MSDIRQRMADLITGAILATDYPVAAGHFHMLPADRTQETCDLGSLERGVEIVITGDRTPLVPVDRVAGFGHYSYPVTIRVGYVFTRAGDTWDAAGEQSGSGTREAIQDRSDSDRQKIESVLGSWRNTGGLSPPVIDLVPIGGGGVEFTTERAILSVPFSLLVRVPL